MYDSMAMLDRGTVAKQWGSIHTLRDWVRSWFAQGENTSNTFPFNNEDVVVFSPRGDELQSCREAGRAGRGRGAHSCTIPICQGNAVINTAS